MTCKLVHNSNVIRVSINNHLLIYTFPELGMSIFPKIQHFSLINACIKLVIIYVIFKVIVGNSDGQFTPSFAARSCLLNCS